MYELLRYYYVQTSQPEDEDAFEADVRRRLERPFRSTERDSLKLNMVLSKEELAIVAAKQSPEERRKSVDEQFEQLLKHYDNSLHRLTHFAGQLFPTSS